MARNNIVLSHSYHKQIMKIVHHGEDLRKRNERARKKLEDKEYSTLTALVAIVSMTELGFLLHKQTVEILNKDIHRKQQPAECRLTREFSLFLRMPK